MTLHKLQVSQFRNIEQASLELSPGLNVLVGRNGSGKTSVLEAIHYLGLGRSFRTHLTGRVIRQGEKAFTLFARMEHDGRSIPVGLSKDKGGETQLKIDGVPAKALAELAELLPVQLIHPDGFDLLTGGPQPRRAWLDWGLFHNEPGFLGVWGKVRRLIKQRNALLRTASDYRQLAFWDQELSRLGEELSIMRGHYCQTISPLIRDMTADFLPEFDISLGFYRGWEKDTPLDQLLVAGFERDRTLGYTGVGPQKADVRLKANGVPAQDILSRGQLKLLVCAMRLAQGLFLREQSGRGCIFLIDDFASELDVEKRRLLAARLRECASQVFVTAIDIEQLADMMDASECRLFHVEQGKISEPKKAESKL
ncbi:DNA replication and repair protein RecF [Aeromonas sp. RU39B]|uniref:DNA replication/repair protein RecF n=1 Tax=Aeromonas sp. RU39B TaxID=1907416 RepID=UPI0009540672|nr:DNA replication/repair protein RecF [Aeromonas sp. RU39B]SIR12279.1 DNA replication and repair protein RecF [Aeromonas sp. RU39B]